MTWAYRCRFGYCSLWFDPKNMAAVVVEACGCQRQSVELEYVSAPTG